MPFEILVAIHVSDDERYDRYRDAMTPILHDHGGVFTNDFRVGATLATAAEHPVNRVFTIRFPDRDARERFFGHPDYERIRGEFFESSTGGATILAEYALAR